MGLMYVFPVSLEENERIELIQVATEKKEYIILKTYGLPMIFWGYLASSFIVLASMWVASRSVIDKLLSYGDTGLAALAYLVYFSLIITPIILLGFFFYEKQIHKHKNKLIIVHKLFFLKIFSKKINLDSNESLEIIHFMDSPNMAKIYNKSELKLFENRGYFELKAISNSKSITIDRHSRKADLIKIKSLLESY